MTLHHLMSRLGDLLSTRLPGFWTEPPVEELVSGFHVKEALELYAALSHSPYTEWKFL